MDKAILDEISKHPDYQLLKRIPEFIDSRDITPSRFFTATIIDLETMGLDAYKDEIIELGMLSFSFSTEDGIIGIVNSYNELNDPGKPIPEEVTKITGISNEDVNGKAIDWVFVSKLLSQSDLVICHNSRFDRNFLELQTPLDIQTIVKSMPFACTIQDIDWKGRGFESSKLDYLNWKLGYFYDGHRAITDCWATLNLLLRESGSFDELKAGVRKRETILCAKNAPYDKKDLLKARKYRWSDGTSKLPKGWFITLANELLAEEKKWLDEEIYHASGASDLLPQAEITARKRFSFRAEELS